MSNVPRLAVLGSGKGSNFVALQEAILARKLDAQIVLVASDLPDAVILSRAAAFGLPTATLPPSPFKTKLSPEGEIALVELLQKKNVEWVILAGYMRVVKEPLLNAFPNRVINIHPSLLPAFPGLEAQQQAFEYGVKIVGCTVHFVDEHLDHGVIILQRSISVLDTDDGHTLAGRILDEEHIAYTEAIARVLSGEYRIEGRRYVRNPATSPR